MKLFKMLVGLMRFEDTLIKLTVYVHMYTNVEFCIFIKL